MACLHIARASAPRFVQPFVCCGFHAGLESQPARRTRVPPRRPSRPDCLHRRALWTDTARDLRRRWLRAAERCEHATNSEMKMLARSLCRRLGKDIHEREEFRVTRLDAVLAGGDDFGAAESARPYSCGEIFHLPFEKVIIKRPDSDGGRLAPIYRPRHQREERADDGLTPSTFLGRIRHPILPARSADSPCPDHQAR